MNELNRMQYLESMGIDSFVPRYLLPAAKSAVLCPLPVALEKAKASPLSNVIEAQTQNPSEAVNQSPDILIGNTLRNDVLKNIDKISIDTTDEPIKNEINTAEIIEEVVLSAKVEAAKFSLSLWNIGDDIFVIDSRRQGDALPTQGLLTNILRAMGRLPLNMLNAEILNWPMVETHDASWPAARQMVHGFIEARIFDKPTPLFLLFGQDACSAVLGEMLDFDENLYQKVSIDVFSADAVILPSLADLLYLPLAKAKVWQSLKDYKSSPDK